MPAVNILRLIYQGRFLHDNVTLGGECGCFYKPLLFMTSYLIIIIIIIIIIMDIRRAQN